MLSIKDLLSRAKFALPIAFAAASAVAFVPRIAPAHTATGSCTVNFDNTFALSNVYGSARFMFGRPTGFNAQGKLDVCANSTGACWTYRHRCATNYVNVDDVTGLEHLHLSFANPGFMDAAGNLLCPDIDPGDGYGRGMQRKVASTCFQPNWSAEPRGLDSHGGSQWVGIQMKAPGSSTTTTFDLQRIRVGAGAPIQFWFHSVIDGNWYFWSSLAANTNWTLAAAHDVDFVKIHSAPNQLSGFRIEDFDIQD